MFPSKFQRSLLRSSFAALLVLGSAGTGCNMFASMGNQARGTANAIGKRNVSFQRPVPAAQDLSGIQRVALVNLEGDAATAEILQSRLASLISDGKRFEIISAASKEEAEASGTEALAIVGGKVVRADYSERTDSQKATCNGDPCTVTTRTGTASIAIDFSVVESGTGKVLLRKTLEETAEQQTAGQGSPPSIDGNAMKDELVATVAESFHGLISPHAVREQVFFETDNKAKSLKAGANRAMSGDLDGAIASFEDGLAEATAREDKKAIAKAQFDLGLALVIAGDYDRGITELEKAQRSLDKTAWREVLVSAKGWRDEATAAQAQWSAGPSGTYAFSPDIGQTEDDVGGTVMGLAKMGMKAAK